MSGRLEALKLRTRLLLATIAAGVVAQPVMAETVDIGTEGSDGPLAALIDGMQSIMDFITGPAGVFACSIMLIAGVIMWATAPKEGAMGTVLRAIAAGILILNIPSWVLWFDSLG